MKKRLMVLAMALMLLISTTAPVAAKKGGYTGNQDGAPGWSRCAGRWSNRPWWRTRPHASGEAFHLRRTHTFPGDGGIAGHHGHTKSQILRSEQFMDARQLIVLYGDTLLMDGVEACLARKHELDVIRVNAALANVGQHLQLYRTRPGYLRRGHAGSGTFETDRAAAAETTRNSVYRPRCRQQRGHLPLYDAVPLVFDRRPRRRDPDQTATWFRRRSR